METYKPSTEQVKSYGSKIKIIFEVMELNRDEQLKILGYKHHNDRSCFFYGRKSVDFAKRYKIFQAITSHLKYTKDLDKKFGSVFSECL